MKVPRMSRGDRRDGSVLQPFSKRLKIVSWGVAPGWNETGPWPSRFGRIFKRAKGPPLYQPGATPLEMAENIWEGPWPSRFGRIFKRAKGPPLYQPGATPQEMAEKIREGPMARAIFAGDYFSISTTNNSSPLNWEYALSIVII